jgi:hypothetical protein
MSLYKIPSSMGHGSVSDESATTGAGVRCSVFPLMLARSGPNMARVSVMLSGVTGQFHIIFPVTIAL